jgi:hypothetical protein
MNVSIVVLWPKLELVLERAQVHLDAGDSVTLVECRSELAACWANPGHALSTCSLCRQIRERGVGALTGRVERTPLLRLTKEDAADMAALRTRFASVTELKEYTVDGFPVGLAVASALITIHRDLDIDMAAHDEVIRTYVLSTWATYRSFQRYLEERPVDKVYVVNGRVTETRAVLHACQTRGISCSTIEVGHDKDHYELYHDTFPHDFEYVVKEIRRYWDEAGNDPRERERQATQYYLDRSRGVEREYKSFVTSQHQGLLPPDFSPDRHNVVIFNSSEDEFASIGDAWRNPVYQDQLDGLRRIRNDVDKLPSHVSIYLRIHPHMSGLRKLLDPLMELKGPRFRVIPPDSPVSTYDLMRACNTVLTFGSTTGIEAVFWEKPSVLVGMAFYRNLGGNYLASDHEDVLRLMQIPLEPKPREAALIYGYYYASFGIPYKYYQAERLWTSPYRADGAFNNVRLQGGRFSRYVWGALRRLPSVERLLNRWYRHRAVANLFPGKGGSNGSQHRPSEVRGG